MATCSIYYNARIRNLNHAATQLYLGSIFFSGQNWTFSKSRLRACSGNWAINLHKKYLQIWDIFHQKTYYLLALMNHSIGRQCLVGVAPIRIPGASRARKRSATAVWWQPSYVFFSPPPLNQRIWGQTQLCLFLKLVWLGVIRCLYVWAEVDHLLYCIFLYLLVYVCVFAHIAYLRVCGCVKSLWIGLCYVYKRAVLKQNCLHIGPFDSRFNAQAQE